MPQKPEVMSPAGHWPQLHAAIEAGADAVYFGLNQFSARAKVGFTLAELPEVMATLHRRGVKGYLTFNTLMFDTELEAAARCAAASAAAGVDAFIVQDLGIARLLRSIAPHTEVHGSTQMSITSAEGVAFAAQYGISRVVLARELALAEIAAISQTSPIQLEIFAHGALCVSYSGQCFSSEAWGGRSANRGQCAQACRLPYELLVAGHMQPLADARYLLSPGDLYALPLMPQIVQLGVAALKIEGRYKDAAYVALTTAAYRKAVDEAWAGLPLSITPSEELQLEQVYSRGLGSFFLSGTDHQAVVRGRAPRHRGILVGRVVRVLTSSILVAPEPKSAAAPLKPGDGLVFDAADWRSPEEPEEGGRVYHVHPARAGLLELEFGYDDLDLRRIRPGDLLWRTHDPELERAVRPLLQPAAPLQRQAVHVHVRAHVGAPLELTWRLVANPELQVTVRSPKPLDSAQNRSLDQAFLEAQLGRLGNTPYKLTALDLDLQGEPFVASSWLNTLRREATDALAQLQANAKPPAGGDPMAALRAALGPPPSPQPHRVPSELHLLIRTPAQLNAALELRPASITLDYLDLYGLRPAVERVQAAGLNVRVASPRILKPNEERIVNFLRTLACPLLVRSSGLLHSLGPNYPHALYGDFSLNAANALSARTLLEHGLVRLTPTHDLNAAQITHLAQALDAQALEVIAYQHLPVFHSEHCIFCRFLSSGSSYRDCGRPCEGEPIALRDPHGRAHPVSADIGCRNTIFGAEAQHASRHLSTWRNAGISAYRLEFVHEDTTQVNAITTAFRAALNDQISPSELSRQLKQHAPAGITEGSLVVVGR
ncbi:protease [Candidatus Viridilinea mediisalina]|uniref:Protease n=2 Tax=Candidatus Viridilinea mediisalina TaxID=2024553 RepID=A0A2A6RKC6_9CHLR|nr:protease [Candidatus Viridilinea mediisalina]